MPTIGDLDRGGDYRRSDERPTPAPARGFWSFFWPLVCLFQLGLLVGGFYVLHRQIVPSVSPTKDATVNPEAAPEGNLDRGDELLREGRYDRALAIYQRLSTGAASPWRERLRYRVALCQEALGLLGGPGNALENYQLATRDPQLAAAAELGQARVAVRLRKPEEAKRHLYGLLLRSDELERHEPVLVTEVHYWLALALALEVLPAQKTGTFEDVVGHPASDWRFEDALDWVAAVKAPGPKELAGLLEIAAGWPRPGLPVNLALRALAHHERLDLLQQKMAADLVAVEQPPGVGPEEFLVTIFRRGSVSELLDRLATQSALKSTWTPAAQQRLEGRQATVAVVQLPLRDTLSALAEPRGVVWQMVKGELHFSGDAETPRDVGERLAAARRALLSALTFPDHALTATANLELGNLAVHEANLKEAEGKRSASEGKHAEAARSFQEAETKLKDAVVLYERLLREESSTRAVAEASYNRGLILRRLRTLPKNLATARAAFYRVIDQEPGHELVPWAYLQIGRTHLEEGDPELALAPLRRALSAPAGTSLRPSAAIALSAASLLVGDPRAAHTVLAENMDVVRQESYRAVAAFLEALARFRAAADPKQAARETRNLLATMKALPEESPLGPVDKLLVLQAYGQMGMLEDMAAFYEKALRLKGEARPRGALAAEMCSSLAESLYAAEKWTAAKQPYASLVALRDRKWAPRARFRLAAIALTESHLVLAAADKLYPINYCLETCHTLLREEAAIERSVLLKLMGQAYMERGDVLQKLNKQGEAEASYRRAADCFEGKTPRPDTAGT